MTANAKRSRALRTVYRVLSSSEDEQWFATFKEAALYARTTHAWADTGSIDVERVVLMPRASARDVLLKRAFVQRSEVVDKARWWKPARAVSSGPRGDE